MKFQEVLPQQTNIEKDKSVESPVVGNIETAELDNEELSQYANEAGERALAEAREILSESENKINKSAGSINASPELLAETKQEQGLDTQLQGVQNEANQLADEQVGKIREIMDAEEPVSSQEGNRSEKDYYKKIELLSRDPNIDTAKVFCRVDTTGLSKQERSAIYDNPENWDVRRSIHEQLKRENIQKALDLSRRIEKENPRIPPPTIFALRGSPGAGKTTALRKGHEMFKGILDEKGQPSGSLAPDVFKGPLKEKGNLSSNQVHAESTMLGRAVKKEVSKADTSMVFDKLMNDPEDIKEMIESARETGRKIAIMDIDVPLELSAVRVLGREKGGEDPNINFKGVADGFEGIRKNREAEFKALDDNPQLVNGYVLMAYDKESKQSVEVAAWDEEAGKVRIINGKKNLVNQSIEQPEEEIEKVKNTLITEEYIQNFTATYFDKKSQQHAEKTAETLRQYLGETIGVALDKKAK